ncbi:hypothetical protein [Lentilactobacillus senioris]|uniref:hypothetical protein n=1 Tax=Lentilactobacillus senioris TaxID=931534 RepID=UPI003D2DD825
MIQMNLYQKGSNTVIASADPTIGDVLAGLVAGTSVAAGDYEVSFVDSEGLQDESERVPVPAFEVPATKTKLEAPVNVKATAAADGALITADAAKGGE